MQANTFKPIDGCWFSQTSNDESVSPSSSSFNELQAEFFDKNMDVIYDQGHTIYFTERKNSKLKIYTGARGDTSLQRVLVEAQLVSTEYFGLAKAMSAVSSLTTTIEGHV